MSQNRTKAQKRKPAPGAKPEHSRSKLLSAGLEVFSRHGFHGATTKMIAKEAGVNEALIMRHFKSKEGLFLTVLKEKKADVFNIEIKQYAKLSDEMVEYGRERLKLDWASANFLKLIMGQFIADDAISKKVRKVLIEKEFFCIIGPRLEHFQKIGQIHKSISIEEASMLIDKQIFITFLMHFMLLKTSLAVAQGQLEIAMRTIAAGLGNAPTR